MLEAYRGTERLTGHLLLAQGTSNEYATNDADHPTGNRYQPWDPAGCVDGPSVSAPPRWS